MHNAPCCATTGGRTTDVCDDCLVRWGSRPLVVKGGLHFIPLRSSHPPSGPLQDNKSYAGAVIASIFMGMLRHALGRLRADLVTANLQCCSSEEAPGHAYNASAVHKEALITNGEKQQGAHGLTFFQRKLQTRVLQQNRWLLRLADALVFGAIVTVGFLNMLIVMAMNPGLMMSVVGGEMLGTLFFQPVGGVIGYTSSLRDGDLTQAACH